MKAVHFNVETSFVNQLLLAIRFILSPKDAVVLRYLWLFGDMPLVFFTKTKDTVEKLEKEGFLEIKEERVYFISGGLQNLSNEENQMKYFIEILWINKIISKKDRVFSEIIWLKDTAERLVRLKMIIYDKASGFYCFPEWLGE